MRVARGASCSMKQEQFRKAQMEVEKLRRQVQKEDMKSDRKNNRTGANARANQNLGKRGGAGKALGKRNKVAPLQPEVPQWRVNVANAKTNFKQNWK